MFGTHYCQASVSDNLATFIIQYREDGAVMAASYDDIKRWLNTAKEYGCTHLIVAVDRFDHDDYPVYVSPNQNVNDEIARINAKDMQAIMEVYKMDMDIDVQLKERRAYHI